MDKTVEISNGYVNKQESKALDYLTKLNKLNNWFYFIYQTKDKYNSIDFKAISTKEHFCDIEVKIRNTDATKYDTIMIDEHKYNALMNGKCDKSYYIQYMVDDSKFWIINIKKLNEDDIIKDTRTIHHTQGAIYDDLKYFIPTQMGDIFEYNNNKKKYVKRTTNG